MSAGAAGRLGTAEPPRQRRESGQSQAGPGWEGLRPASSPAPPPAPAWGLRAPDPVRRTCARGTGRWSRCARPWRPAGPRRGVAHRAPTLQRHVLPEQQLQLMQEAHGGAALRPPPRRGPLVCAPRWTHRPPRCSASPARGAGSLRRDRLHAGSAPAAAATATRACSPPAPPPLKGAALRPTPRPRHGNPARNPPRPAPPRLRGSWSSSPPPEASWSPHLARHCSDVPKSPHLNPDRRLTPSRALMSQGHQA